MNLEWLTLLLPFYFILGVVDDAGGGDDKGGKGDEDSKGGDDTKGKETDAVSKADHEKVISELNQVKEELEDARMEVMTPEYLDYLDQKDKGKGKDKETPKKELSDDAIENLSKKELLELATANARKEFDGKLDAIKKDAESSSKAERAREVAAFGRTKDDFAQYRPIMYGLSLDKKNADLSLQELYDLAKKHVKELNTEPTKEEKDKQRKMKTEKPGSSSASVDKDKKYTPESAADEAWEETVGDGELPPAV